MQILSVTPPNFNSNIYVFRQNISSWLTKHVDIRNNIGTFIVHPDDIHNLDLYLKQYHFRFLEICKTIEILETDVETYSN